MANKEKDTEKTDRFPAIERALEKGATPVPPYPDKDPKKP